MAGVPRLQVAGLPHEAAIGLLLSSLPEPIDPAAAAQIAVATGGNPLALIDLAGELSVKRLTEAGLADEPIPVGPRLEALLPAAGAAAHRGRAAVAAGGGRGLHRERRPDPGRRRPRWGCAPRPADAAEAAGLVELVRHRPLPAPAGPVGGVRRRAGQRAPPGPRRARRGRGGPGHGRARGLARRQGDPRDRRGRGGPAGAGRRPGRAAGWRRLAGERAGPGLGADPGRGRSGTPGWSPRRRRRWPPARPSSPRACSTRSTSGVLDPLSTGTDAGGPRQRGGVHRRPGAAAVGGRHARRGRGDARPRRRPGAGHPAAGVLLHPAGGAARGRADPHRARHPAPGRRPSCATASPRRSCEALGAFILLPYADAVPADAEGRGGDQRPGRRGPAEVRPGQRRADQRALGRPGPPRLPGADRGTRPGTPARCGCST